MQSFDSVLVWILDELSVDRRVVHSSCRLSPPHTPPPDRIRCGSLSTGMSELSLVLCFLSSTQRPLGEAGLL